MILLLLEGYLSSPLLVSLGYTSLVGIRPSSFRFLEIVILFFWIGAFRFAGDLLGVERVEEGVGEDILKGGREVIRGGSSSGSG